MKSKCKVEAVKLEPVFKVSIELTLEDARNLQALCWTIPADRLGGSEVLCDLYYKLSSAVNDYPGVAKNVEVNGEEISCNTLTFR